MIGVCGHHAEARDALCGRCLTKYVPIPVRHEGAYCPCCGMNAGHHWTGCHEAVAS